MRTLRGMGPRGLLPHEEEQIREAADALLFCTGDESDEDAREALANAVRLVDGLVQTDRWPDEAGSHLLRELEACGPLTPVS
jgi:hypothetical protein